jgi:CHAT domain-containing protein
MHLKKKFILLFFLTSYTLLIFAQNHNFHSDSIRAGKLYRMAINLGKEGLQQQALDTFFVSLAIRKNIYGNKNYKLGSVYSGIGISYKNLGNYDLALKYFNLAEKNYSLSNRFSVKNKIRIFTNIGNVYRHKLDFSKALQYFNQILSIYTNNKKSSAADIASINYKIADIYYQTKNDKKALKLIWQNINHAKIEDQVRYYILLAFINQIRTHTNKAKNNYKKAIELTTQIYGKNHINVGLQYLNYSLFLLSNNEFRDADKTLKFAYKIIKITQPKYGEELAFYYSLKGNYIQNFPIEKQDLLTFSEQKKKNLREAIQWYSKALTALKFPKDYSPDSIRNSTKNWISLIGCINYLKKIATTYTEIAFTEQNKKSENYSTALTSAIKYYRTAGALIQKARVELSSDKSKIQLTELEFSTFQNMIETTFDAYSTTQNRAYIELAFQCAERIKSSSVFDQLSNEAAQENSLIPDSLLQLEQKLNSTISIYSEKLHKENGNKIPDSIKIMDYTTTIFNATRSRENLNHFLETEYNDYYNLKYSASMLPISEIQKKLAIDEVILEYVFNEKDSLGELYTFVISKNSLDFRKQDVDVNFIRSIEFMFHFLSNPEYAFTTNEESKQFCVAANRLYNRLISPFAAEIQNKKLTIVADGKLNYIAFDALLQNLPDTTQTIRYNKLNYLIKTFDINYAYSSNLLFKNAFTSQKAKIKTAAFAPVYQADTVEINKKRVLLMPLPGVQKEVKLISQTINTKIYSGDDATEQNFRNAIGSYDILHLAMHAYINDSLPGFSQLVFTPTPTENTLRDGLLTTTDIYNLKLKAHLTVLSACNTGSGQLKKGEGIMSLARGFFYAGCPSIIMSLWEVEDESGTQIMGTFYKNIKRGKTKSEALRAAKLKYLAGTNSRRAHPHYWLGYITIGDNSPLYKSYDFYFYSLLFFILVGISIDQTIRINNNKKARKKRAS